MPSLSDLLGRFRQSQFGTALSKLGESMSMASMGGQLTPNQLTPPDAQNPPFPSSETLESQIAARTTPPGAIEKFQGAMARPLSSLLSIPAGRVQVPGSQDFTSLTGQETPAQGLADWLTEAGSEITAPGNVSQALIPFGLRPFSNPEAAIKSSIENSYYARRTGAGLESRALRTEARKPGVGVPVNPRTVLTKGEKSIVVGKNTPEDSAQLVLANHPSDEAIWEAALWYDEFSQGIADHYDTEAVDAYKLAFAVTQAANSPESGLRDVLRAERIAGGMPEPAQPGSGGAALAEIFAGRPPKSGIGQKVSEMIDEFFGKKTRTQMMDRPRYGAPVVGDRHMFRSDGLVDPAYKSTLADIFGPEQTARLQLDTPNDPKYTGRVTESQFEYLVQKGNEDTAYFNAIKLAGHDDWTPGRAQAAKWSGIKTFQGDPPVSVKDMFAAHYSQAPMELAFGTDSPFAKFYPDLHELPWEKNQAITTDVLSRLGTELGDHFGVRVVKTELTQGVYGKYKNPNVKFTLFGTEKARQDWVDAMAYGANQTALLAYRPRPAGEGVVSGYDLRAASSLADTRLGGRIGMSKFLDQLQAKNPIFNNAEVTEVDGHPTVRLINVNEQMEPQGHWTPEQIGAIDETMAAVVAGQPDGFSTTGHVFGNDITTSHNNYTEVPNGQAHLQRFSAEGRSGTIARVQGPLSDQTHQWISEAFRKHAPDEWNTHFGAPDFASIDKPGGGGTGRAGGAGAPKSLKSSVGPYKTALLGRISTPESMDRGWILPDGTVLQVHGSHETSLANAAGVSMKIATDQYPALAAKAGLIRTVTHMGKSGLRVIAEIFTAPTDAQINALSEWQKACEKNHLYDEFFFALTDPITKQAVRTGNKISDIRRVIRESGFDIPF